MASEIEAHGEWEWRPLIRLDELPTDGTGRVIELGDERLAVFAIDGVPHVIDDACPHEGASLGEGVVCAGEVTCPWHAFHFELASGRNTDGLDLGVRVYAARVGSDGAVEFARDRDGEGACGPHRAREPQLFDSVTDAAASSGPPGA